MDKNTALPFEQIEYLKKNCSSGSITCLQVHQLSQKWQVRPQKMGSILDQLQIKIIKCQLGLFGVTDNKKYIRAVDNIPANLVNQIENQAHKKRLSCRATWEVAKEARVKRRFMGDTCKKLGIRITDCQLGTF